MRTNRPDETSYWDAVARQRVQRPQKLWSVFCDALNEELLRPWLPSRPADRLLKTDLWDEATSGGLWPALRLSARQIVGIDISLLMLRAAYSANPQLQAVGGDVRRLPLASETFDVIVSNSTLDHFQTLDEVSVALSELQRTLRQGGKLLLTLDNLTNPVVAIRNHLPWRLLNRLSVVPYYVGATCGARRLHSLLEEAGFEVRQQRYIMHCPRLFAVAIASVLDRIGSRWIRSIYCRLLMALESLETLPTRRWTGYFIAVRAVKLPSDGRRPAR